MLDDRDYMRQPEYRDPIFRGFRWSWTVVLIAAYALVLIAELVAGNFPTANRFFYDYLALSKEGLSRGFVWQLVTYQFMHAGFLHLLFNSWAIFIFGRELETILGGKKFLALIFSSGIVGGVFQIAAAILFPSQFGGWVVGASAGAFGLVAAFALIFPERDLQMLVFFIIPITIRAKTLLIISAVLAVVGMLVPSNHVANAAHLGGMAMGCFFVKVILRSGWSPMTGPLRLFRKAEPEEAASVPERKSSVTIFEDEVDPILDKISAHGIESLTARERETLENARKKIVRP